ncbi:MAG TPA: hypothetical protein VGI63_06680 [Verrucomicrobiae bacterium]
MAAHFDYGKSASRSNQKGKSLPISKKQLHPARAFGFILTCRPMLKPFPAAG